MLDYEWAIQIKGTAKKNKQINIKSIQIAYHFYNQYPQA